MRRKLVRLTHPDLPGQVIEVAEEGVPFRRAAGWVFAPDPPPPEPEDDEPEDDEPEDDPEKAAPRRRRKTEKE